MNTKPSSSAPSFWTSDPAAPADPPNVPFMLVTAFWWLHALALLHPPQRQMLGITRSGGERQKGWGNCTSRDNIVHHDNFLSFLQGIRLHLEKVLPVLFLIDLGLARTGQLTLLPHRDKAGSQLQGQAGPEKEAPGLEADNDVRLLAVDLDDM